MSAPEAAVRPVEAELEPEANDGARVAPCGAGADCADGHPPLPEGATGRKLRRLGSILHQAGQIFESLAADFDLAAPRESSLMSDPGLGEGAMADTGKNGALEAGRSASAERSNTLVSVAELARLLGVGERTVRRWRTQGKVPPAVDLGGVLRWRRSDIDAWLDARTEP